MVEINGNDHIIPDVELGEELLAEEFYTCPISFLEEVLVLVYSEAVKAVKRSLKFL